MDVGCCTTRMVDINQIKISCKDSKFEKILKSVNNSKFGEKSKVAEYLQISLTSKIRQKLKFR
jgi:hypothetical protein